MRSQGLVVGGGIACVVLNVVLALVLVTVAFLRSPQKERKENLDVHKYSKIINEKLGDLDRSSRVSLEDISPVRQYLSDILEREGNLMKPAIHLGITDSINKTDDDVPVLTWHHLSMSTLKGGNVSYEGGAVTVTQGGYYYIYSTIRYSGEGTTELDYGRIIHSVLMKKESEVAESPTILMRNLLSTPSVRRGRLAFTTSSLGGTCYLAPRSKVMVTSSIPVNIDKSSTGTYFGLFLV